MPKRFRLTRRFNAAMTEDADRRRRRLGQAAGRDVGEALSFVFENSDGVIDADTFGHRSRLLHAELDARKHCHGKDRP